MEKKETSFLGKITKSPFLVVLFLLVVGISVFVIFTLSRAVDNKIAELEAAKTTQEESVQESTTLETQPQNTLGIGAVKKYSEKIESVNAVKEANRIAVTVTFADEESLLQEHYAQNAFSVEVVPVFCFYINNGTQIQLPGELRLMSDGKSVVYYLSEINDLANVAAMTDNSTITLDNIMSNEFNIYLQHTTRDGVGRTILGTYAQNVERFEGLHSSTPFVTKEVSNDIRLIKSTVAEEFVWIDIYFKSEEEYNKYNSKLKNNFICFGLEHAGKLFKWDFIVTEYDNLYMLRCKFDTYSMAELLKEMEAENIDVKTLFEDYKISVWCSDYANETDLFCINDVIEVRQKLNKSTAGNN